jgi:hypothetical protein
VDGCSCNPYSGSVTFNIQRLSLRDVSILRAVELYVILSSADIAFMFTPHMVLQIQKLVVHTRLRFVSFELYTATVNHFASPPFPLVCVMSETQGIWILLLLSLICTRSIILALCVQTTAIRKYNLFVISEEDSWSNFPDLVPRNFCH